MPVAEGTVTIVLAGVRVQVSQRCTLPAVGPVNHGAAEVRAPVHCVRLSGLSRCRGDSGLRGSSPAAWPCDSAPFLVGEETKGCGPKPEGSRAQARLPFPPGFPHRLALQPLSNTLSNCHLPSAAC